MNPQRFTICKFFKQGNCKFGATCKHLHPENYQATYTYDSSQDYLDEECCICLEKVLKSGR